MTRGGWVLGLKAGISVALLALLLSSVDRERLLFLLLRADPVMLTFGLLAALGSWVVNTLKWQRLLAVLGTPPPYRHLLALNLVGLFYSIVLPGQVGGEIVKGVRLARMGVSSRHVALSIGLDRLSGLMALGMLGFTGLLFTPLTPLAQGFLLLNGGVALASAAPFAFAVVWPLPFLRVPAGRGLHLRVFSWLLSLWHGLGVYCRRPGVMAVMVLQALGAQALVTLANHFAARSVGVDLPAPVLMWIVATVSLVNILPVALAGLGLREGAYVFLLQQHGIPLEEGLSLSLAVLGVILAQALIGGMIDLLWTRSGRALPPVAPAGGSTEQPLRPR